ncbi:hypothetical protein Thpro_021375 [Acidihalobacter prosperus]|uniref:Uncharacterized protein n=1 Tax=Acidihalobacter prosperus TaxID=160660 RepID=A0A1A6C3A6_9GAMM|nr:hypothetical protein Thpro_021375 [Acidihalobacter prosperus]
MSVQTLDQSLNHALTRYRIIIDEQDCRAGIGALSHIDTQLRGTPKTQIVSGIDNRHIKPGHSIRQ